METRQAPYAPPSAVLKVIRHYVEREVPERVTLVNLMQIGVTDALAPRTLVALKFLRLIEDDGLTTEKFRALRFAKSDEYRELFGNVLDAAYREILDHVDVGTATDVDLANAFRPYSPGGQRNRMVTLFVGLAREAGWELPNIGQIPASASRARTAKPKPRTGGDTAETRKPEGRGGIPKRAQESELPAFRTGLLFGVTDDDIAALDDAEFDQVWDALGKIARARSRRGSAKPTTEVPSGDQ